MTTPGRCVSSACGSIARSPVAPGSLLPVVRVAVPCISFLLFEPALSPDQFCVNFIVSSFGLGLLTLTTPRDNLNFLCNLSVLKTGVSCSGKASNRLHSDGWCLIGIKSSKHREHAGCGSSPLRSMHLMRLNAKRVRIFIGEPS